MSAPVVAFVVAALACVVAHVAILLSVVGRRANASAAAGVPRPRLVVEILWALLPIVVLAFVLTATWDRVRENARARPPEVMKVAQ